MRPSFGQSCLAVLLKFFNFLQTFVGISILIYSVWVLNRWNRRGLDLDLEGLPAPWFICAIMGAGVLLCLIAFTGHIAAEVVNGCCLCFFAVLTIILILLEATLVSILVFDKHWEENLPYDSTEELKRFCAFIKENMDICKWVAVTVIVIQALSLLLAMILRAMVPARRVDYDSDEDFVVIRRPLLDPQGGSSYASTSVGGKGFHSDFWSSQMRQKYGLNQSEFSYNGVDQKAPSANGNSDNRKQCSIL
ncbi:tetraspanin-18 [Elaeis guineensis]|uniref:Tetraspanin-20 n=1 Tax=Elaeis guineensis var. tenera TaxID=51953 RepID=A0A6I9S2T5_ELAGV|nr:tetraspanin-20 [Elaeis guineensis]